MVFGSMYCSQHCVTLQSGSLVIRLTSPGRPQLLTKYQGFQDVFSWVVTDTLAPRKQQFDSTINPIPGTSLPTGRLYALSEPELKDLWEYLDKKLQHGFIHPSQLPLSASVLFVKKKSGELWLCNNYVPWMPLHTKHLLSLTSHPRTVRMANDHTNL